MPVRTLNDPPVKEVRDARPCLACGKPTWSRAQICVACKWRGILVGPRRKPRAGTELERMRAALPLEVRYRLERRLFLQRYGIPQGMLATSLCVLWFVVLFIATFVILSGLAIMLFALNERLAEALAALFVCGLILVPLLGAVFVTSAIMVRLSRQLVTGVLQRRGDQVLVNRCPACDHDQRGTAGDVCPECAARIVFPMD